MNGRIRHRESRVVGSDGRAKWASEGPKLEDRAESRGKLGVAFPGMAMNGKPKRTLRCNPSKHNA